MKHLLLFVLIVVLTGASGWLLHSWRISNQCDYPVKGEIQVNNTWYSHDESCIEELSSGIQVMKGQIIATLNRDADELSILITQTEEWANEEGGYIVNYDDRTYYVQLVFPDMSTNQLQALIEEMEELSFVEHALPHYLVVGLDTN